jgi:hypothetical protein
MAKVEKAPAEAKSMLHRANDVVYGEREQAYGSPRPGFERLAKLWSALIGVEITAHQAALLMAVLKTNRAWDGYHADSVLDGAGYFAIADRIHNDPED